jgi:hypothetical protein
VGKIHPDEIRELAKLAEHFEDKAHMLEVELEAVERERDSLKRQTEHLERMVEVAIGILDALGACPMRAECQRSQTVTPRVFRDRTECKACLRDYVFQKAKEEKSNG